MPSDALARSRGSHAGGASAPDGRWDGLWSIALLETAAVPRTAVDRLTATERALLEARGLPARDRRPRGGQPRDRQRAGRRRRWLAGRVAVKRLALAALEGARDGSVDGPAGPHRLGPVDLQRFDAGAFRALEVLPGADGRPVLRARDRRRALPWHVSISHAGAWTAVCLADRPCGIDLERVARRHPAFERHTFTAAERTWARRSGAAFRDRRITTLWTLKEALLKTGAAGVHGLWDLPRLELDLEPAGDAATGVLRGRVAVRARGDGGRRSLGRPRMVLATAPDLAATEPTVLGAVVVASSDVSGSPSARSPWASSTSATPGAPDRRPSTD